MYKLFLVWKNKAKLKKLQFLEEPLEAGFNIKSVPETV